MSTKKRLFSILLAAVLLCACMVGILFTGAAAEGTVYYVRSMVDEENRVYPSIDAALAAAESDSWAKDAVLTVLVDDASYISEALSVDEYGILFGQKTIWRGEGEEKSKLPIIIDVTEGNSFSFAITSGISMACANDYTFRNLTLPMGDTTSATRFYAGSGEVKFEHVAFGSAQKGVFLGDNFTKAAYIGWDPLAEGETVTSSLTFGEGTSYGIGSTEDAGATANEGKIMIAAGFTVAASDLFGSTDAETYAKAAQVTFQNSDLENAPDIRPCNTKAGIIIDTRTNMETVTSADLEFGRIHGRNTYSATDAGSPVNELFIELRSGNVVGIVGDDHVSTASSFVGDVTISIYGGNITLGDPIVRAYHSGTLYGDLTINVGEKYDVPTTIKWLQSDNGGAVVKGNYNFCMTGGNVDRYYGAPDATGTILNEVSGGTISRFDGTRSSLTSELKNEIKGSAIISSAYYGGSSSDSTSIVKVINEISDRATFRCAYYGGGYSGACEEVENRVLGGTFEKYFYGGIYVSNTDDGITKSIVNSVSKGTFESYFYGASAAGTFANVKNHISGGTFESYFYGGCGFAANHQFSIQNEFSGGSFAKSVYGGSSSAVTGVGDITNTVTGGEYFSLLAVGNSNNNAVSGAIRTDFRNATDENGKDLGKAAILHDVYYGGGGRGTISSAHTTVEGDVYFGSSYYGGSYLGDVTGDVTNEISGGVFDGKYYGGSRGESGNDKTTETVQIVDATGEIFDQVTTTTTYKDVYSADIDGTIYNKIYGGKFLDTVYGGSVIGDVTTIRNTIEGGTFAYSFYGTAGDDLFNTVKVVKPVYNDGGHTFKVDETTGKVVTETVMLSEKLYITTEVGTIYNTIDNPTPNAFNAVYLGGYYADIDKIINTIEYGHFQNYVAGGGYAGTVGTVENTINGGIFAGSSSDSEHFCFYGGGYSGAITITGSITNKISGGEFRKYSVGGNQGGTISSVDADYAVKNVISGGTFRDFWGGSAGSGCVVTGNIVNELHGGVFDAYETTSGTHYSNVFSGGCRNSVHNGNIQTTVYGGTFLERFVGGSTAGGTDYTHDNIGTVTTRLVGGDFYGDVYISSYTGTYTSAELFIDPDYDDEKNVKPLNLYGSVGLEGKNSSPDTTKVTLCATEDQFVMIFSNTSIYADVANGTVIEQTIRWENGVTYLTMPAGTSSDSVEMISTEAEAGECMFSDGSENVTWTGYNGFRGASMLLTDRIAVKVYFDKEYIDSLDNFSFSLTDETGNVYEGGLDHEMISTSGSYYTLSLSSVSASNFHKQNVLVASGCGKVVFSILDLCNNAVNYEYSGKTGDFAYLAKAIYNLGLEACRDFHGDGCYASNVSNYENVALQDDVLTLKDDAFDTANIRTGEFQFVAAPLILESGVGIQFYGSYDGSASLAVYIDGTYLNRDFYTMEAITPTAQNGYSNYRFLLRIKALYLHETFTVGVRAGSEENYSTIVCSVAAACNQYVEGDQDYDATRSLLAYVEAVYHYINREEILQERRDLAVAEMYRMMTVIWTPTEDFEYSRNNSYYTSDGVSAGDETSSFGSFKKGYYYSGIPYAHGSASTNAFLSTGTAQPDENGVYTISPTFDLLSGSPAWARLGNDCNDAVFWAWAASCANIYNEASAYCTPTYGVVPVGDYDMAYTDDGGEFNLEEGELHENLRNINGKTPYIWLYNEAVYGEGTMYEALSQLKPGDALVYHIVTSVSEDDADEAGDTAGHVMMVQEIHVVRNDDGSVNPDESYLLLMDQTSSPMGSARDSKGNAIDPHAKWQKWWNEELGAWVYQCPNVNRDFNGDGEYAAKSGYDNNETLHKRTFTDCAPVWNSAKLAYKGGYLPVTAIDFVDASPLPVIEITDSLAGTEMDQDSIFDGTITSNYRISHATITLLDENNNVVKTIVGYSTEGEFSPSNNHQSTFNLARLKKEIERERSIYGNIDLLELTEGENYTCVVTVQAGTVENIEVRRFSFTADHSFESPVIPFE